jgi:hypothetical protein
MRRSPKTLILIIAVCLVISLFPAGALADYTVPGIADGLTAPQGIQIIRHSVTSATIDWDDVDGAEGYELFRSENGGAYTSIGITNLSVYFDRQLVTEQTYNFKIRAYKTVDNVVIYSDLSAEANVTPQFTLYYQGDSAWKFGAETKSKACLMTAYSIVIKNMGIDATPRTVYKSNGNRTMINITRLKQNMGVETASALPADSKYLASFDGRVTKVNKPSTNGVAAVKEALRLHPEGVILYFKQGSKAHAIVACKVEGDTIYFSDPGRDKGRLLTFEETWVSYHHHMTFANLSDMIALDMTDDYGLIA